MKQLANIGFFVAIALLICLLPMPYGYYTLIRFVSMVFFTCYDRKIIELSVIAGALALLFQPFVKISLGREMWNIVDIIVAFALFIL